MSLHGVTRRDRELREERVPGDKDGRLEGARMTLACLISTTRFTIESEARTGNSSVAEAGREMMALLPVGQPPDGKTDGWSGERDDLASDGWRVEMEGNELPATHGGVLFVVAHPPYPSLQG